MTNREKFLEKLSKMDKREMAAVMCNALDCDECPAAQGSRFCQGIDVVEEWIDKEAEDEWTDFS